MRICYSGKDKEVRANTEKCWVAAFGKRQLDYEVCSDSDRLDQVLNFMPLSISNEDGGPVRDRVLKVWQAADIEEGREG